MASNIRIKRSAVSGKRPALGDVDLGELALNTYDGYLFSERDTGGVGIGTTVALLTPWTETYGAASIYYSNTVGIGTTSPNTSYGLDVVGDINTSTALRVGGTDIADLYASNADIVALAIALG